MTSAACAGCSSRNWRLTRSSASMRAASSMCPLPLPVVADQIADATPQAAGADGEELGDLGHVAIAARAGDVMDLTERLAQVRVRDDADEFLVAIDDGRFRMSFPNTVFLRRGERLAGPKGFGGL